MSELRMFTIYRHPWDYPDHYVVRGFTVTRNGPPVPDPAIVLCDSLEEARAVIPPEADARLDRSESDAEAIVETWI